MDCSITSMSSVTVAIRICRVRLFMAAPNVTPVRVWLVPCPNRGYPLPCGLPLPSQQPYTCCALRAGAAAALASLTCRPS